MAPSATSTFHTSTGTGGQVGSTGPGMNSRINFNDLPFELLDDLELLQGTDVTDTAPFRTWGYDHYRTMSLEEIQEPRRRGITNRPGVVAKPTPMQYDEFIGLVLGNENHQTMGLLFYILHSVLCHGLRRKTSGHVQHDVWPGRRRVRRVFATQGRELAMKSQQNYATCTTTSLVER